MWLLSKIKLMFFKKQFKPEDAKKAFEKYESKLLKDSLRTIKRYSSLGLSQTLLYTFDEDDYIVKRLAKKLDDLGFSCEVLLSGNIRVSFITNRANNGR